ncbi:MAG: YabP/YqfC family sporulation protein [Ruminococcus sp.]|nr:YabP/YqfC family sporulation protein [Ruminococcus sp.]
MKKSDKSRKIPSELTYNLPIIEFTGDRSVLVEGSTGVLKYDSEIVRINTRSMIIAFFGRGLTLKCISPTAVIIDGYITKTEFIR